MITYEKTRRFPVEDLPKQVPGRNYPYETLLDGIVQRRPKSPWSRARSASGRPAFCKLYLSLGGFRTVYNCHRVSVFLQCSQNRLAAFADDKDQAHSSATPLNCSIFSALAVWAICRVLHLCELCGGGACWATGDSSIDQLLPLSRRNLSDTWREDFSQRLGSACARECAADREHDPNAGHGTRPRHENIRQ